MASVTSIVNNALRELGGSRITSLTDGTTNANIANDVYTDVRQAALRSHHWNFATTRVKLGKLAAAPVFGFDNKFQLSADHLRVVAVYNNDGGVGTVPYRIEQKAIHSNADDLYLEYIKNVTDPNLMTSDFRRYLEFLLAAAMAMGVTNSRGMRDDMDKAATKQFRKSKGSDSIENYPDAQQNGSWLDERDL